MVKVVKKLSKIIPGDKKQIEKIKKEIQELNAIASKGWIMEKIPELEES